MAKKTKKTKKTRKKNGMTLPVAVIGGFMPMATYVAEGFSSGGPSLALGRASIATTGYNPYTGDWRLKYLMQYMGPVAIGLTVHKVASKFGVNRMLASAGIPLLRL